MKKCLLLSLILIFSTVLNTGCNSNRLDQSFGESFQTQKYDNGTVMMKDKDSRNSNRNKFELDSPVNKVNIGPGEIKFGPEGNF